jgi:hypothetical protein
MSYCDPALMTRRLLESPRRSSLGRHRRPTCRRLRPRPRRPRAPRPGRPRPARPQGPADSSGSQSLHSSWATTSAWPSHPSARDARAPSASPILAAPIAPSSAPSGTMRPSAPARGGPRAASESRPAGTAMTSPTLAGPSGVPSHKSFPTPKSAKGRRWHSDYRPRRSPRPAEIRTPPTTSLLPTHPWTQLAETCPTYQFYLLPTPVCPLRRL